MLSRIYAKIKSSRIKSVLQYVPSLYTVYREIFAPVLFFPPIQNLVNKFLMVTKVCSGKFPQIKNLVNKLLMLTEVCSGKFKTGLLSFRFLIGQK